jgi:transposase-like protein
METRKRRRFTAEYKGEAVKRLEESGKALQQVAAELGVHANQLRGWRNERLAAGSARPRPWRGRRPRPPSSPG